jgi:DNA adenine methylase
MQQPSMASDAIVRATRDCAPFLRWAGSKRRLLPVLKNFWTRKHKRYVEPFAGSACLFFAINPPKAILGDLNAELIATYIEVKYRIDSVLKELESLGVANKEEYQRLRATNTSTLTLTSPSFCTSTNERVYITGRACELAFGAAKWLAAGAGGL